MAKVPSPTGKPSKVRKEMEAFDAGYAGGGKRPAARPQNVPLHKVVRQKDEIRAQEQGSTLQNAQDSSAEKTRKRNRY